MYFVTQNPLDVPDTVLGQLGNRVQHALRAFTPRDQKAVKAAATTMRANPKIDTEKAIIELGVGEALISFLDEKGRPAPVERAFVLPPASRIGPITPDERKAVIDRSPLPQHVYANGRPRIRVRAAAAARDAIEHGAGSGRRRGGGGMLDSIKDSIFGKRGRGDSIADAAMKSVVRSASSTIGREIVRGMLGSLLGKRR